MSTSPRTSLPLLAVLLIVSLPPVHGQPSAEPGGVKPRPGEVGDLFLATDSRYASHLETARKHIDRKDWEVVLTLLQKILDLKSDPLVEITRPGRDGKETRIVVGLRDEAGKMVAGLPAEVRARYQEEYGPQAAEILKQARMFKDVARLDEVVRRFLHTEAGSEAAERLALHHLDQGNALAAALTFDKLLSRSRPNKLSPLTLYKATLAYRRVSDQEAVERLWKVLEQKLGKDSLQVGLRSLKIDGLRKEMEQSKPPAVVLQDWPLFRGDASRSARQAAMKPVFLHPVWRTSNVMEATTRKFLTQAVELFEKSRRPALPPFFPVVVRLRVEGSTVPLVVSRDYWGIRARVVKQTLVSGETYRASDLYFEAPSPWSIDRMVRTPPFLRALTEWLSVYLQNGAWPSVLFENSTVSTLNSDGVSAFYVEDFQVPPYIPPRAARIWRGVDPKVADAIEHNRLHAIDLDSGKLLWEVGAHADEKNRDPLKNTFFLGPPLPLNGKLHVLAERKGELRLLVLDPRTGKLLSLLPLGEVRHRLPDHSHRRVHAAHLAHADGILVCPTNVGVVLGIDLARNRLVWSHGYRQRGDGATHLSDPRFGPPPPGAVFTPQGKLIPAVVPAIGWVASAPIIQDGRVIIAPPDSSSLTCLSVRDGRVAWKQNRRAGDLYVGGISEGKVLVVGSERCRALGLADGKELWSLETGVPSGVGVLAGRDYYLPLKEAARFKKPAIAVIDVAQGKIVSCTRSPGGEAPGNLVFFEGHVLSQSLTSLTAYPLLEAEQKRIDALLKKNADDPEGRFLRATLRLDGNLAGAIEDLCTCLKQEKNLSPAMAEMVRDMLYEVLTEQLHRDFASAEKYLKEYAQVCEGKPERMVRYHVLLARGREGQGKYLEAMRAYLSFAERGREGELIEVPGEPGLKMSPVTWARTRIAALLQKVPAEERRKLEAEIEQLFRKSQSKTQSLRDFVALFGAETDAGRRARLLLGKRLGGERFFTEAQMALLELRQQPHDPRLAAQALDLLAWVCLIEGQTADALAFYRELSCDFARVVVRDGKTARELLESLSTDKRFLPYLKEEPPRPLPGPLEVTWEQGAFPLPSLYEPGRSGETFPFFRTHRLALRTHNPQFKLLDATGKELWSANLPLVDLWSVQRSPFADVGFLGCHNVGHLLIVPAGHKVIAIDPVKQSVRWDLEVASNFHPLYRSHVVRTDGRVTAVYTGDWTRQFPAPNLATPQAVCVNSETGLVGVHPTSGKILWKRIDLSPCIEAFRDDRHLFVVVINVAGKPLSSHVLRIADGTGVPVQDFTDLYSRHRQIHGGTLLLAGEEKTSLVLRRFDVLTGKDRWKKEFAPRSVVLTSQVEGQAGVVEPTGKFTLIDVRNGKESFTGQVEPKHLDGVKKVRLLRDDQSIYLACERSGQGKGLPSIWPNLLDGSGLRSVPVDGAVYSFDAANGKLNWQTTIARQMLIVSRFREMPVLLCSARLDRERRANEVVAVLCRDKQTGKLLYESEDSEGTTSRFHTLRIEPDRVELTSVSHKLRVRTQKGQPRPKGP